MTITSRLSGVRERIADAARRAGRTPSSIRLIAVSKTFPIDAVRAAAAAGHIDFGENKVQEGQMKILAAGALPLRWHLIGHLQANKAKTTGGKADGVLVTDVEGDSEAALKGLRAGDVIVDVGGKTVGSVDEVVAGIKRAKELGRDAVLMRVRSANETNARFVGLSFKKAG